MKVMNDRELRKPLINRGYENINGIKARFSVDKLLEVYKLLI